MTINLNENDVLIKLLSILNDYDKYECIAGIPGPNMEMRSGTLPSAETDVTQLRYDLLQYFNLDQETLEIHIKNISAQYCVDSIIQNIRRTITNSHSQDLFIVSFIRSLEHKLSYRSINYNKNHQLKQIDITVNNKIAKVTYPDELVSVGLISEIFMESIYGIKELIETVDYIYDLGANIGLSAVYFSMNNPNCHIVCVEPYPKNIDVLKNNLRLNNINAEILNIAVSNTNGEATLYFGDQSHALPSLYTIQKNSITIQSRRLDEIVKNTKGKYGIKIDIEGSESLLTEFEAILRDASFIVGELHYSKDFSKNQQVDRFFHIINQNFKVQTCRPVLYFIDNDIELCICYQAVK